MGGADLSAGPLTTSGEKTILEIASLISRATEHDIGSNIVNFATLAEAHVDRALKKLIDLSGALENRVGHQFYKELHDSIYRSWDSRYKWISQAFDVSIAGAKFAQDFKLLIELRNAIVHGGGRLTAMQTAKIPQMMKLKDGMSRILHAEIHGHDIFLDQRAANAAAKVCREYIIQFDTAVISLHKSFDV
ncbi:hypothetical protein ACFYM3_18320 [Streptomyces massasporeus]|uniref:RiboL-PSP-HEPN domain-containing protein n=1 Tax=Streptomyces massasporeus TaxID=67324 RepID=A0ABW6LDM5_9ACTN